jgi:hypothetical protein
VAPGGNAPGWSRARPKECNSAVETGELDTEIVCLFNPSKALLQGSAKFVYVPDLETSPIEIWKLALGNVVELG